MDKTVVQLRMRARQINMSELARRVGISRQAVALWFQQGASIRIRGEHLLRVARALNTSVERLHRPLTCLQSPHREALRAKLLWDGLYPSLEALALAANAKEARAIARLVEVYGLYAPAKMLGQSIVWRGFPDYKALIPPVRRRQLEALWRWKTNR